MMHIIFDNNNKKQNKTKVMKHVVFKKANNQGLVVFPDYGL
jgi:hypothetical protein